jgi:ABC-type branched-subunit amino acid transport system ATPase component
MVSDAPQPGRSVAATVEGVLLRLDAVSRTFGGVRALDGVSFAIGEGTIHGLIGPNGAGKTTAVNLISGLIRPSSGEIRFRDRRIDRLPAHRIAALGVRRTYQNIRLFPAMSAAENLLVGMHSVTRAALWQRLAYLPAARREEERARARSEALLRRVGLAARVDDLARNLSYGQQRRLEIARALASDPQLLLLDEPTAGMNPAEAGEVAALIRSMAGEGRTVLLVEHNMSLVMTVCERITVLDFGRVIAEGTPDEIRADPIVVEAYLGSES